MTSPTVSFEFFPAKTPEAEEALFSEMAALAVLEPQFMTVTYGAGGSTKAGTMKTLHHAVAEYGIPMASHLTFLSTVKEELDHYIETLWEEGVKHIVALRGDLPEGKSFDDFKGEQYHNYTSEFVEHILAKHPFEISVAAYPEKHPDAPSMDADIEALKKKCDAGATRAITQFFFDNDQYFRFVERVQKAGISTPVVPGILPIHSYKSMCGFAERCGAGVPDWVHEKFDGLKGQHDEAKKIATELLVEQAIGLARGGVEHIHFYTLNKADMTREACEALHTC